MWRIAVHDTGTGVPLQAQARLFQPFVQADNTTTREFGGTGLGLVISRELAQRMSGRVGFESEAGRGSTFWVELPQRTAQSPNSERVRQPLAAGKRVILAVAHDGTRHALAEMFAALGAQVEMAPAAQSDADAFEPALRAGPPIDMVLLDSAVPAAGTADRLRALRQRIGAQVRLVTLSPMSAGGDTNYDYRDADGVLLRPVMPSALAALVERLSDPQAQFEPQALIPVPGKVHFDAHVLLAEDAPLNREIAAALLKNLGCTVQTAENGAQAVQRVQQEHFDLVLMDCQMPELDGFEATRLIRVWEGSHARSQPLKIVALTANALSGDHEACLAAGMSDYMAKPITGARLAQTLARHLPVTTPALRGPATAQDVNASVTEPAPPPTRFDPAVLAALPMVADGSEPEFATQVLAQYLRGSAEIIERCDCALTSSDLNGVKRWVHTLKSTSAQVGATALAALAADIEERLRGGAELSRNDLERLVREQQRAAAAIAGHLNLRQRVEIGSTV
jgi:CheY-like chemotaxis protein/HPt (histidine-containing phosphotransfer) domain-containing protein